MLAMISSEDFPPGVTVGYAKSQVKDILKAEFNKSVEIQVNKHLFKWKGYVYLQMCVCVFVCSCDICEKSGNIWCVRMYVIVLVFTMLKDYLRVKTWS